MIKFGLKIWSIDKKEMFSEAVQLFFKKEIDFIELYTVPDSFILGKTDFLDDLKNVPTIIHSPHTDHNFDIFWLDDLNIKIFKEQVVKTADFLGSKFIILHAGVGDSEKTFEENVAKIKDKRILIENMCKVGLVGINEVLCFGYSLEQLKFISNCGFDFCLDFAHAIKSALSQKIDYKKFIEDIINQFHPFYFHISNGKLTSQETDEHMDLFDGQFDIKWIKESLLKLAEKKDVYLVFETPKIGNNLENDIKNMNYFRSIK